MMMTDVAASVSGGASEDTREHSSAPSTSIRRWEIKRCPENRETSHKWSNSNARGLSETDVDNYLYVSDNEQDDLGPSCAQDNDYLLVSDDEDDEEDGTSLLPPGARVGNCFAHVSLMQDMMPRRAHTPTMSTVVEGSEAEDMSYPDDTESCQEGTEQEPLVFALGAKLVELQVNDADRVLGVPHIQLASTKAVSSYEEPRISGEFFELAEQLVEASPQDALGYWESQRRSSCSAANPQE